jgi:protein TonB
MRTVLNYITKAISVSAHTLSSEFLLRPGMEGVSYSWLGGIALLHVGVFFALASAKSPAFSDLSPPAITMQVEMIAPAAPVPARVVEQVAPRVEPVPKKSPRSPKRPIARPAAPVTSVPSPAAQVAEPEPAAFADAQPTEVSSDRHSPPDSKHSPAPVEISQPRFDAGYLKNPAPAYPPASRRLGEEGRVVLRVLVDRDGVPGEVAIKTSSGFPRLDQAAEDAVRRWKFVPARQGDEAVRAAVLVPIVFNLRD